MTGTEVESRTRRQRTLAVLGHVDHGKTALVRALTGIETDRLAEERQRGLSIVPGYAWFESDDACIDLIDAPGHQAFIRAMIAASSGIDAAVLVIAANEGVMPQTREHVAIAGLLGIGGGIVVLSKCDLVGDAQLVERRSEVRDYLKDTFLRDAPILESSAIQEQGIAELRDALIGLGPKRSMDAAIPFFMPVDRSFSKAGFGRVVTGTVHAGTACIGDDLEAIPGGDRLAVRGIQMHGASVAAAQQGDRAALNLRGSAAESIVRGSVLCQRHAVVESRRLDVRIEVLPEFAATIKNGASLRVLIATAEAQARLRLLEHESAQEHIVLAQLRCDRALPARAGMRFILRSNSPAQTVAGGVVIDPMAPRRRRFDKVGNTTVLALADADRQTVLQHCVHSAGAGGIEKESLLARLGILPNALDELINEGEFVAVTTSRVCSVAALNDIAEEIEVVLSSYHQAHPQHSGMNHSDLAAALDGAVHESVLLSACARLKSAGRIQAEADRWRLSEFDSAASLSDAQRRLVARIEDAFAEAGVTPPAVAEIVGSSSAAKESLRYLLDSGRVIRLQTRDRSMLALHASAIDEVREQIGRKFPYPSRFAVKDVRDLLGTTRKHVVPLLEHLDATGFTLRQGDLRQIRR